MTRARIEVYRDTLMLEGDTGNTLEMLRVGLGACGHMCGYAAPYARTRCCTCVNWTHLRCFLCIKREKFSA